MDDTGATLESCSERSPITVEIVQGKKEELYWERVPPKVRGQAVRRAIELGDTWEHKDELGEEGTVHEGNVEDETRKRKRRKTKSTL